VNIEPGLVVVILAVLVFYLRLIIMQRQRAKQLQRPGQGAAKAQSGAHRQKNTPAEPQKTAPHYTVLSQKRIDRVIGAAGALLIVLGLLLYAGLIYNLQAYWWIPTALGIVAFSWLFKL